MTRLTALFALAAFAGPAVADPLPVAPPPREVRPDGTRDPAPEAAKAEDPEQVVARIIANAKQASDKLAAADAGAGTRATQSTVLKDIDALLNPPDSPPKGGGGDSSDMPKQDKNDGKGDGSKDQKKDGKDGSGMPDKQDGMGNKGGNEPKGGMNPGGMGQPKDGMNPGGMGQPKDGQASAGRRPRAGGQPKDGKEPGGTASAGNMGEKQPAPPEPGGTAAKAGTPKDPQGTATAGADPKGDRPPPLQAQVPLADEVAKEVWGHLPERLRQQMSQYYREEFMPRYAGLLKQYYSSLSAAPNGSPAGPRPAPPR